MGGAAVSTQQLVGNQSALASFVYAASLRLRHFEAAALAWPPAQMPGDIPLKLSRPAQATPTLHVDLHRHGPPTKTLTTPQAPTRAAPAPPAAAPVPAAASCSPPARSRAGCGTPPAAPGARPRAPGGPAGRPRARPAWCGGSGARVVCVCGWVRVLWVCVCGWVGRWVGGWLGGWMDGWVFSITGDRSAERVEEASAFYMPPPHPKPTPNYTSTGRKAPAPLASPCLLPASARTCRGSARTRPAWPRAQAPAAPPRARAAPPPPAAAPPVRAPAAAGRGGRAHGARPARSRRHAASASPVCSRIGVVLRVRSSSEQVIRRRTQTPQHKPQTQPAQPAPAAPPRGSPAA